MMKVILLPGRWSGRSPKIMKSPLIRKRIRKDGRSAVAASAYRSGRQLHRDETDEIHDYTRKSGITFTTILTPENAPDFALDRQKLWNAVEAKEKRKNSQFCREFEVAIPHELNEKQARQLVMSWATAQFVELGMVVDIAFHDPEPGDFGNRNHHAHLMTTTREFDSSTADGWAKTKNREWNERELLQRWRESWAEAQNQALEAAGSSERVDERTLEAQRETALAEGREVDAFVLDRPPEPRLGVAAAATEKRAKRKAAREGYEYEPVTQRGAALQESHSLRSRLFEAASSFVSAAKDVAEATKEVAARATNVFVRPFLTERPEGPSERGSVFERPKGLEPDDDPTPSF